MSGRSQFSYFLPVNESTSHVVGHVERLSDGQLYISHLPDPDKDGRDATRALLIGQIMKPVLGDLALPVSEGAQSGTYLTPYQSAFETLGLLENLIRYTPEDLKAARVPYLFAAMKVAGDVDFHANNIQVLERGFAVFDYDYWGYSFDFDVDTPVAIPKVKSSKTPEDRFKHKLEGLHSYGPHHWPSSRESKYDLRNGWRVYNLSSESFPSPLYELYDDKQAQYQQYDAFIASICLPQDFMGRVKQTVTHGDEDKFTDDLLDQFKKHIQVLLNKCINSACFRAYVLRNSDEIFERLVSQYNDYNESAPQGLEVEIGPIQTTFERLKSSCYSHKKPLVEIKASIESASICRLHDAIYDLMAWRDGLEENFFEAQRYHYEQTIKALFARFQSLCNLFNPACHSRENFYKFSKMKDSLDALCQRWGVKFDQAARRAYLGVKSSVAAAIDDECNTYAQQVLPKLEKYQHPYDIGQIDARFRQAQREIERYGLVVKDQTHDLLGSALAKVYKRASERISQVIQQEENLDLACRNVRLLIEFCRVDVTDAVLSDLDQKIIDAVLHGTEKLHDRIFLYRRAMLGLSEQMQRNYATIQADLYCKLLCAENLQQFALYLKRIEQVQLLTCDQFTALQIEQWETKASKLFRTVGIDKSPFEAITQSLQRLRYQAPGARVLAGQTEQELNESIAWICHAHTADEFVRKLQIFRSNLSFHRQKLSIEQCTQLAMKLLKCKLYCQADMRHCVKALEVVKTMMPSANKELADIIGKAQFRLAAIADLLKCKDKYSLFGGHSVHTLNVEGHFPKQAALLLARLMHPVDEFNRHTMNPDSGFSQGDYNPYQQVHYVLSQKGVLSAANKEKFFTARYDEVHKTYVELYRVVSNKLKPKEQSVPVQDAYAMRDYLDRIPVQRALGGVPGVSNSG